MAIDLARCNGCNACVVACKTEHNAPNGILLTVILEREVGRYPNANRQFIPVLCNHCAEPPCVPVCPTKATYSRADGIVLIDWKRCIGCGACIDACPYDQRFHVKDNRTVFPGDTKTFEKPDVVPIPRGVPIKCDFCFHRVDKGLRPACVEICPTDARIFGPLDGGEAPLDPLISRKQAWTLLPDKGTKPNVYYY
jgi:molybdopterin-containing oxidoreductase family iron-sulfur binding subunit